MAATEPVTQQEFLGRNKLCDEREKRSSARLRQTEEQLSIASSNLAKATEIQNQILSTQKDHEDRLREIEANGGYEKIAEDQKDHEQRLRAIESKGGKWLDKIISGVIGAAVAAFMAYIIYGGVKP
jgi:hypothetical protein